MWRDNFLKKIYKWASIGQNQSKSVKQKFEHPLLDTIHPNGSKLVPIGPKTTKRITKEINIKYLSGQKGQNVSKVVTWQTKRLSFKFKYYLGDPV